MKRSFKFVLAMLLAVSFIFAGCSNAKDDSNMISNYDVENANYQLNIDASNEIMDISELLYGIFFEDINFAADGGLYAEMVANRSFEFTEIAKDDEMFAWSGVGEVSTTVVKTDSNGYLNANNPSYIKVTNNGNDLAGIQNRGFLEGMAVKKENYRFSVYSKALNGYSGSVTVKLVADGKELASAKIDSITDKWEKYDLMLGCNAEATENVFLQVLIDNGDVALDMISLFPENTYNGRLNGMRNDIGTMLEELQPKFLRFPGGCVIEGFDEVSAYDWKASVGADVNDEPLQFNGKYGDVASRRIGYDIWTDFTATDDEFPSFMTYGLGFFEFFQLSEDIGAIGVPVINAGLYCQARGGKGVDINSPKFQKYINDMLDLVEFCRGDVTTKWGKVRADLGHSAPFELKYIAVGNENWGDDYFTRYNEFVKALNKAKEENPALYNGVELIYSAGTDDGTSNTDYIKSYENASKHLTDEKNDFAGAIDHHYYNDAAWFLKNANYYDEENYSRTTENMTNNFGGKINVFLGEYASWSNKMYSALSEAAYMTSLERNGDIVAMSTYAPLLSSTTARHWAPDLIWFNNAGAIGSTNYYTQMLFSRNQGSKLLDSKLDGAYIGDKDVMGRVGVGTWATSAKFDNIKITDNKTGEILAQDDFSKNSIKKWEAGLEGKFKIKNGALVQPSVDPQKTELGTTLFFGDKTWTNYTFELEATKLDGEEGFFLPILSNDSSTYYWNIGGYGNTVSCLQQFNYGYKTGQLEGTVKDFVVETNKSYKLKVVADGTKIKCYIDDVLYVDYETATPAEAEAYQVVSTDETGDIIIKLVNVTGTNKKFAISLDNAENVQSVATAYQVKTNDLAFENVYGAEEKVVMDEFELNGISDKFNYTAPKYSATVIRIHRG